MAASRRKQDDKNLEILRELISLNGNKYCLDCNQRGPTYVNTTIGSFVCSKCSGMLRGLTPPHRVKSISMATFAPEEIEFVKVRGNDYCRRVWLGLYEGESVNFTDEQSVKDFMSDKYEKKRYYLESPPNSVPITNGNISLKSKMKGKLASINVGIATPLISIAHQGTITSQNNNVVKNSKIGDTTIMHTSEGSHKLPRPTNNLNPPVINKVPTVSNTLPSPAPVPEFPVDFSTANIYNSAQFTNSMNNNITNQPTINNTLAFNAFSSSTALSNDRYAALADLDLALRQQNMKNMEEGNTVNRNPFQCTTTTDLFANKNPFFNGGWNVSTPPAPVNPFVPANNGSFVNPKNPFL